MAAGAVRDLESLRAGLRQWLGDRHPDRVGLEIEVERASAGLANETVLLRASWTAGGRVGTERLAVRLPAVQATFPDSDLALQARVQTAVAAAGIPVPSPTRHESDPRFLGVPFLAMPFVDGRVGPQAPAIDPDLLALPTDRQRMMVDGFLDLLADLHRVEPTGDLVAGLRGGAGTVADEIRWWDDYLEWAAGDLPPPAALVEQLRWCAANRPGPEPPPSFLWGDPRLGNAIYDADQRIVAALDWDMAFIGPAEHDLGWYLGLDELANHLIGRRVPGFPDRSEALDRYESRLGRAVVDLDWYEIFALVRSVAVTVRQARVAAESGTDYLVPPPDRNPLIPYVQERISRSS